jgi:hypothetical protein
MSVIAGCSVLDGVFLAADCRATIKRPNRPHVFVDNVQKIFPVATGTAMGFVGSVQTASALLQSLYKKIDGDKCDPVRLSQWIPRLLRYEYRKLKAPQPVAFLVASALWCRPNIIERQRVVDIMMRKPAPGRSSIGQQFFPSSFARILSLPSECRLVSIPGTSKTALYAMRSPDFRPETFQPLQIAAIGSGEMARTYIEDIERAFLAGEGWTQSFWLRLALRDCVKEQRIDTVGGLYPVLKVKGEGFEFYTESAEIPMGGTKIELDYEDGTWTQKNLTTGKEIRLVLPWEVRGNQVRSERFDDLEEAQKQL